MCKIFEINLWLLLWFPFPFFSNQIIPLFCIVCALGFKSNNRPSPHPTIFIWQIFCHWTGNTFCLGLRNEFGTLFACGSIVLCSTHFAMQPYTSAALFCAMQQWIGRGQKEPTTWDITIATKFVWKITMGDDCMLDSIVFMQPNLLWYINCFCWMNPTLSNRDAGANRFGVNWGVFSVLASFTSQMDNEMDTSILCNASL